MSASTHAEPADQPSGLPGGFSAWVRHQAPRVAAAGLALQGAALLTRDSARILSGVLLAIGLVLIVRANFALGAHERGLCTACLRDMPVDGPERAERRYRRLWYFHVSNEKPLLLTRSLLMVATSLCAFHWVPMGVAVPEVCLSLALNLPALLCVPAHRKVAPWCPYCGWDDDDDDDDGGGDDDVVDPDPDPAVPATPPVPSRG